MGRRRGSIVGAGLVGAAVVVGAVAAAAIFAPERAFLPAEAIAIGNGLGRDFGLGGFSDLQPEGASGKEYWTITDRGPNFDGQTGTLCTTGRKVYPLPAFAPEIVRVGMKDDELRVKERIPLRFPGGPAVGTPVRPAPKNEVSVDGSCAALGTSPRGIDSEGIAVDPRDGSFWIADEYLPSVLHVTRDGAVVARIVPAGAPAAQAATGGVTVVGAFPETVGANFRPNRGFESVAISPSGEALYVALQSPLEYRWPTGDERPSPNPRNSLALRVFRLDIGGPAAPSVDRQWIYPLDVNGGASGPLADKVSAMLWLAEDVLAVEERDDPANDPDDNPQNTTNTRLYVADFGQATPIEATSAWNALTPGATTGGKSLEQWYIPGQGPDPGDLPAAAPKCLWIDVAKALRDAGFTDPNAPSGVVRAGNGKIEGIAYLPARGANPALLAVLNDNDFGLAQPIAEQLDVLPAPAPCTPGS
jgi:hypothetical protein